MNIRIKLPFVQNKPMELDQKQKGAQTTGAVEL